MLAIFDNDGTLCESGQPDHLSQVEETTVMHDCDAANKYWQNYLDRLPAQHCHRKATPDAFAFGGGGLLGDELGSLVLSGSKRATTSLPVEFTSLHEPLPEVGSVSIILRGDMTPIAIIERIVVKTIPFGEVDEQYAAIEGEGDGSLASWRKDHIEYFSGVCDRLGGHFDERTPVICQIFRVVWPLSLSLAFD